VISSMADAHRPMAWMVAATQARSWPVMYDWNSRRTILYKKISETYEMSASNKTKMFVKYVKKFDYKNEKKITSPK
jgi:hypothetical protein